MNKSIFTLAKCCNISWITNKCCCCTNSIFIQTITCLVKCNTRFSCWIKQKFQVFTTTFNIHRAVKTCDEITICIIHIIIVSIIGAINKRSPSLKVFRNFPNSYTIQIQWWYKDTTIFRNFNTPWLVTIRFQFTSKIQTTINTNRICSEIRTECIKTSTFTSWNIISFCFYYIHCLSNNDTTKIIRIRVFINCQTMRAIQIVHSRFLSRSFYWSTCNLNFPCKICRFRQSCSRDFHSVSTLSQTNRSERFNLSFTIKNYYIHSCCICIERIINCKSSFISRQRWWQSISKRIECSKRDSTHH